MEELETPGLQFAVLRVGKEPIIEAHGYVDIDRTAGLTRSHCFRIGSASKLFVGHLALVMAETAELNLADAIDTSWRTMPDAKPIVIEHLGRHTSGLPDPIRNLDFRKAILADPGKHWLAPDIISFISEQETHFDPGDRFRYSNTNTVLLGEAIATALDLPLETALKNRLFDPWQLEATSFDRGGPPAKDLAKGYRHAKADDPIGYGRIFTEVTQFNSSFFGCAGNLISNADDLAKALPYLLDVSENRSPLIAADFVSPGKEKNYGFCLQSWDGFVGHRGDVPGYQAVMAVDLKSGNGYIVLCNLSNTSSGKMPADEILVKLRAWVDSADRAE